MESTKCTRRLCCQPAVDKSPITCEPLCNTHMKAELTEVQKAESTVEERIAHFKKYKTPLRLMQQRLTADLQLLDDSFSELRETLEKCQNELTGVITKHHDQLLDSLRIVANMDDFEKELRAAKEENNVRQAYLINRNMAASLQTLQLDSKLTCMDDETQEVKMAAFPDVNSRVRDLQACIEMQLMMALYAVQFVDVADTERTGLKLSETKEKVEVKCGPVLCSSMCSNTKGFVIDSSGSIVKANEASSGLDLPQPSIFIASGPSQTEPAQYFLGMKPCEYKIHLISTDSEVFSSLTCSWDADKKIIKLLCDNDRQLLYVAQKYSVTVTDLSGELHSRIALSELHDGAHKLHSITGDSDKLFVLARMDDRKGTIFGLSKDSGEVQIKMKIPETCYLLFDAYTSIAVREGMLRLSDYCDVSTICTITGQHVYSESVVTRNIFLGNLKGFELALKQKSTDSASSDCDSTDSASSDCDSTESDNNGHVDQDGDVARLFYDYQTVPRVSALMTTFNANIAHGLLIERSRNHCVVLLLENNELYIQTVKIVNK